MSLRVLLLYGYLLQLVSTGICCVHDDNGVLALISSNVNQGPHSCRLPSRIHVSLTLSSHQPRLTTTYDWGNRTLILSRNDDMRMHAPVYAVTADKKVHGSGINVVTENFTIYDNEVSGSYFSIQCLQKSSGDSSVLYNGVFFHNGTQYLVRPCPHTGMDSSSVAMDTASHGDYIVIVSQVPTPITGERHDYIYSENSRMLHQFPPADVTDGLGRRHRRQSEMALSLFHIDVLVVVDYSVFTKWLLTASGTSLQERQRAAKEEIRNYYALVLAGVDLRYRNIGFGEFNLRIQIAGYVISDNPERYNWTHIQQKSITSRHEIDADRALNDFGLWINTTSGLPEHDHSILFTGDDLYTRSANKTTRITHTSGLAFIGTLCQPGESVSIVEEQGGFQSVGTAAHEIGHSMGARHDGEGNDCRSEDRYIMAASGFGTVHADKRLNPWHFSRCSIEYFRQFIAGLLADDSKCLTQSTSSNAANGGRYIPDPLPGQMYNPDEQCQLIWGPSSYLCRGPEFGSPGTICTAMYCRDPSSESDCVLHTAARGTSCGNTQWCIDGQCIFSGSAPAKPVRCVFGDQPGKAFNGLTCEALVTMSPSYCYQVKVKHRCCGTCSRHYTWIQGCEYGDRSKACLPWHCTQPFHDRDILSDCCGTCKAGNPVLTTVPTTDYLPSTVANQGPLDACLDRGYLEGVDCGKFLHSYGAYFCYTEPVYRLCCQSCKNTSPDSKPGCEYGDRSPDLCLRIANVTTLSCTKYSSTCCHTCVSEDATASGALSSHIMTYISVFVAAVILYHVT